VNNLVKEKLLAWRDSPLLFTMEAFDWSQVPKDGPSKQQVEGLQKIARSKRTSIRSGHGTGKDAYASWVIWWFMVTRAYPKVACTAPTAHQLSDVLWSELHKWYRMSIFQDEFVVQKDKIFHKDAPKEWWCRQLSIGKHLPKEQQAEALAGLHAEHMLIVGDEASGIPDPVFIPLEGAMTQEDNKCLLIGNPTQNTGYFHDTQFDPNLSKLWNRLHWDSRKSENVSPEMIDYFRIKYGEGTNVWRIRVEGNPPLDDDNTYIPLSWAMQCVGNEIEVDETWPLYLGVDVARYGDDYSVILPRQGMKVFPWTTFNGMNTIELAQRILIPFSDLEADGVGIDEIGVGGGVVDWHHQDARGLGRRLVHGINTNWASNQPEKFFRLRDEIWGRMRENCMHGSYSFPDIEVNIKGVTVNLGHELANELATLSYGFKGSAIKVESKDDAKKRGIVSPNIADALGITEYFYLLAPHVWNKKGKIEKVKQPQPWNSPGNSKRRYSWQGV
jgi:phage terminase large subunit